MAKVDIEYHKLLETILENGYLYNDPNREGVKRLEIPSYTFRHKFKDGFPAISTKKLHYKNVVTELLWFLKGDTNIKYLIDNGCNIWNKDAYNYFLKNVKVARKFTTLEGYINLIKTQKFNKLANFFIGDLGPVYGHQWRNWETKQIIHADGTGELDRVDQIENLIQELKDKPLATDHIVNSWNVGDLKDMALPPCHYGFQVVVRPFSVIERIEIWDKLYLNDVKPENSMDNINLDGDNIPKYGFELHWQQRSVDTFLGLPYNIASYATLALILEKITGYKALAIQGDLKKVHLYDNSLDAIKEQLSRDPNKYNNCKLYGANLTELMDDFDDKPFNLDEFISELEPDDIYLVDYESYPAINVEMLERDE